MAGYSGTPLARKLGIKPGTAVHALGAPRAYRALLEPLPEEVRIVRRWPEPGTAAFVHFFARRRRKLEQEAERLAACLAKTGMVWLSWPKKSSPLHADLGEGDVRRLGLAAGLVDVKICAVDADWSGLKFVYRLTDR